MERKYKMIQNKYTIGDPRSFFYYKGDFYINGTEIVLKDEYIKDHKWNGRKLWKYARYDHQTKYNGRISYFFTSHKLDWLSLNSMGIDTRSQNDYAAYFVVDALELENAIEEITKPIKFNRQETEKILEEIVKPKHFFDSPENVISWLVYIGVLIGSLIFKEFYIIWVIVTVVFLKFKNK